MNLKKLTICILALIIGFAFSFSVSAEEPKKAEEVKKAEETKSDDKIILAEIGDRKITLQDINKKIGELPPQYKMLFSDSEGKSKLLNQMIQQIVFAKKARELKIGQKPEVSKKINDIIDQVLSQELFKEEVMDKISVSDDNIKKYYEQNSDKYTELEKVKARHILIKVDRSATDDIKSKAEAKAKEILAKAKAGEDFAKLAKEFSEDTGSSKNGGSLGFFAKGRMVKEFEDVAFKLKPGEISDPVETKFGYHIIKVEEKKPETKKSFDEVKSAIRNNLVREDMKNRLEDYTRKLYEESKVVVHPELLNSKTEADEDEESVGEETDDEYDDEEIIIEDDDEGDSEIEDLDDEDEEE